MSTKFGKFSTSGNKPYTPKPTRQPKAPPPKSSSKSIDTTKINAVGGFRRLGSPGIKKFYGA